MTEMRISKTAEELEKYDGDDRIISTFQMEEYLKDDEGALFSVKSNIPSLDDAILDFRAGEMIVLTGATKHGKCMGRGTKLLMYDGTIKNIEDVVAGDLLMGDDSKPRKVLNTCKGTDVLYRITPWQGDSYSVNREHILCLQRTKKTNKKTDNLNGKIIEISVEKYLLLSNAMKHLLKTYRVPVDFPEKKVPFEPYLLGLWLGDGSSHNTEITTADDEIVTYLRNFADKYGFYITETQQENNKSNIYRICQKQKGRKGRINRNDFLNFLREYDLIKNKHIPLIYKCNSETNRLKLLAGIIDADGCSCKSTRGDALEFISKSKKLIDDVAYLCRSLGFSCTPRPCVKKIKKLGFSGNYWRMRIGGDSSRIPCLLSRKNKNGKPTFKNVLRASFKVEREGVGEYYGFMLDGNGRYLLADFQVTHNTLLAQTFTKAFISQEEIPLWFSYELPPKQFLSCFGTKEFFYMPKTTRANDMNWLEERIWEGYLKYNTRIIFIDHLHFLFDMVSMRNPSLQIGSFVRRLKQLAIKGNFIIFLICHTRKAKTDDLGEMSHNDIRDSSFISQESDCVIMVHRKVVSDGIIEQNESKIKVEFHRRTGVMGRVIPVIKQKNGYLGEISVRY